jgi:hypothetical protein
MLQRGREESTNNVPYFVWVVMIPTEQRNSSQIMLFKPLIIYEGMKFAFWHRSTYHEIILMSLRNCHDSCGTAWTVQYMLCPMYSIHCAPKPFLRHSRQVKKALFFDGRCNTLWLWDINTATNILDVIYCSNYLFETKFRGPASG